jgi:hypothetical protein
MSRFTRLIVVLLITLATAVQRIDATTYTGAMFANDELTYGDIVVSTNGDYKIQCLYSFWYGFGTTLWLNLRYVGPAEDPYNVWDTVNDGFYESVFFDGLGNHQDQYALVDSGGHAVMQGDGNCVLYNYDYTVDACGFAFKTWRTRSSKDMSRPGPFEDDVFARFAGHRQSSSERYACSRSTLVRSSRTRSMSSAA